MIDIPTVFDNYSEEKDIQFTEPKSHKKKIRLDLWDTAGIHQLIKPSSPLSLYHLLWT